MSETQPIVLIVDDEFNARDGLRMALEGSGYKILTAANGQDAMDRLGEQVVDVMISDIRMPGMDGLTLFEKTRDTSPGTSVILMTAYGTVETAVQAMKQGAFDYLTKPLNLEEVELSVVRALATAQLRQENETLRQRLHERFGLPGLVGQSQRMQKVYQRAKAVALTKASVLLEGETGTGKEVLARAIHESSPRSDHAMVAVNCAALPESLLESELFGHERGAFTGAEDTHHGRFERAHRGTLFLDEISEASLTTQVKLLRVLQEQTFERVGGSETLQIDVRVIAATNVNLHDRVKDGRFREDLYYRLNVVSIEIPPLRERREDIPLLATHFLSKIANEYGKEIQDITPRTLELMQSYDWPGNVRQLRNCVETMLVLHQGGKITEDHLPQEIASRVTPRASEVPPLESVEIQRDVGRLPLSSQTGQPQTLDEMERHAIVAALDMYHGNKSDAARVLGVGRSTLYRKMGKYGISDETE